MKVLPYIEQEAMAKLYVNWGGNDSTGPRYSQAPNVANVTSKRLDVMTCPSDTPRLVSGITCHNYAINLGNTSTYQHANVGGVVFMGAPFNARGDTRIDHITRADGTSNTIMLAEVV